MKGKLAVPGDKYKIREIEFHRAEFEWLRPDDTLDVVTFSTEIYD